MKLKQRFIILSLVFICFVIILFFFWELYGRPNVLANDTILTPASWNYMPLVIRPLNTPTPTITPPTPIFLPTNTPITPIQPGYWDSDDAPIHFHVTADGGYVEEFSVVTYASCGTITIYITELLPIINSQFSFDGQFYGNGIFNTNTSAYGQFGVDNIYVYQCDIYVNFDLTNWTAFPLANISNLFSLYDSLKNVTPTPSTLGVGFRVEVTNNESTEMPIP